MIRYAIFNKKRNRFWSLHSAGYTDDPENIGQYSQARASEILTAAEEKNIPLIAISIDDVKRHRLFKKPKKHTKEKQCL